MGSDRRGLRIRGRNDSSFCGGADRVHEGVSRADTTIAVVQLAFERKPRVRIAFTTIHIEFHAANLIKYGNLPGQSCGLFSQDNPFL